MKKIISLLITLSMLFSLALPAFSNEAVAIGETAAATEADTQDQETEAWSKVVAVLSEADAIAETGLIPSTENAKSGEFSALMEGDALKKNTTIPVITSDFSDGAFLEFDMFNPGSTATAFALTLISDNPNTKTLDHYYFLVACNFTGWMTISNRMQSIRVSGTPMGLDSIDEIIIMPGYGDSMVDPATILYLDDIKLTNVQSENANKEEERPKLAPAIVFDPEKGLPPGTAGGVITEFDGRKVYHWGPGDEVLRKGFGKPVFTPEMHMERYQELVIEVYSTKNTGNSFLFRLYGGQRFYTATWITDWEGEWKEIRIPIAGGQTGYGDFRRADSSTQKVNFEIYEATFLTLTTPPYASTPFFPNTEVYIGKIYLDGERQAKTVPNPTGELIYSDNFDPDTMTDYVSMVKEKHPDKHHPRLVVTDEIIERIKKYKDSDAFMKKAYDLVEQKANTLLETPPEPPYGANAAGTAQKFNRTIEDTSMYCGLMYLLTDDPAEKAKYAERVWAEVENMANSDKLWTSTSTGLDSAHVANGMAIAYDWLYDYWNRDQKLIMRNAMMENALSSAIKIRNLGYMSFRNNVVAANSKGYMSAVLAICDEPGYENLCNEFINNVIRQLPVYLYPQFYPDGNYAEGIGYWRYTLYSLMWMFDSMNKVIGTDGGLSDDPGIKTTALLPFGIRGPMGAFNHSDSNETHLQEGHAVYHYLADRYDLPSLRAYRLDTYEKYEGLLAEDLLWYNPEATAQLDWREGLPNDYFYAGLEPTITFRSSYEPDGNFIAGKGGNRMTGHDQSDAGTYVLDALGVRWISDTGAGVYNADLPDEYYYRNRAEGHNVLYFNPQSGGSGIGGQTVPTNNQDTLCPIVDSGATDGAAFAVFDLHPAYQEDTVEYKRGMSIINNRTQFVVRDEFIGERATELYSYFHTSKSNEITINPDGKSLTLKAKNGQYCMVNFITDIPSFELGVMEAVPHEASPVPGPDNVQDRPASTLHKFYLHANGVKDANITVVFTPMAQAEAVKLPNVLPLSDWDKYLENTASLTGVSVDGVPLAEFSKGIGSFNIETDKVGTVSATAPENVELVITQANALGEAALIKATNKNTGDSFTYKVNFIKYAVPGLSTGVEFAKVDAHHIPEPQNGPDKLNDGDMTTRFAIDGYDGSANFVIDLGTDKYVTGVSIAFYGGGSRKNKFNLAVSLDNVNWTTVFDGFSPGNTDQLLNYEITPSWARYVRFTGYGAYAGDEETQASKWNSISEFVVQEQLVDFADTQSHWAQPEILFARTYSLVNGVGDNMYMPENSVTRAEFIAMVARACKFAEVAYEEGTFSDVKADDWYSANIATAKDKGIIPAEMIADGSFKPNQKLTREEMCAIAALAYSAAVRREAVAAGTTGAFADLSDGPYLTYIDKAIGLRLVNGMSANTFAPKADITRAQAAAILGRLYLKIYNTNN